MLQIVFFSPPADVINGGIKYIFRMAETLRAAGHNTVVIEEKERRPQWFLSNIPIVGQNVLKPNPDQVYVLPEDQVHLLATLKDWPQRKIIYSQNHFYSTYRLGDLQSYADFGVSHVLCSSRTICDYMRVRHPKVTAHFVPYSIDTALFKPAFKHNRIAFIPRKRPVEAAYIRDLFRFTQPQYRDWEWQELSNMSEADVARAMNQAKVFLSLSRLEGFGLTPLEAMAAGCVVTGFTGIGGREYATAGNGFWASEDDFPACIDQIKAAIDLSQEEGKARESYFANGRKTLAAYTPEIFRQAVKDVWEKISI